MRLNQRNVQPFWYALYASTEEDHVVNGYDDYGNPIYGTQTGTYVQYGNPVKTYGVISPARGIAETRQFGEELDYDRVIMVEDRKMLLSISTMDTAGNDDGWLTYSPAT